MAGDPLLVLIAGPNGAGKSTLVQVLLQPVTHLPFVNADVIAAERWPDAQLEHAYEASRAAAELRVELLQARVSFITETVFSHPSKVDLVRDALAAGYRVELHVLLVPEDVAVLRVAHRVGRGGHDVPEQKVRERYRRLWPLVVEARGLAHRSVVHDNSTAKAALRVVATYQHGLLVGEEIWPSWTPGVLRS